MLPVIVGLVGLALVALGLGLVYLPLAPLAVGAALVRLAVLLDRPARPGGS